MSTGSGKVVDLFGHALPQESSRRNSERVSKGRYAEFMVCAYLSRMGHHVIHVDTIGFDLVLVYEGQSYRVQVKSSKSVETNSCQWHSITPGNVANKRWFGPRDADLIACYHSVFDTVVFVPVLEPLCQVRLPLNQVRAAGIGEASLAAAVKKLCRNNPR